MNPRPDNPTADDHRRHRPFRRAVLRGLGVVLPPLLTIVILFWVLGTVHSYVLSPLQDYAEWVIVAWQSRAVLDEAPPGTVFDDQQRFTHEDRVYKRLESGKCIPGSVYFTVYRQMGSSTPSTSRGVYQQYVRMTYLQPQLVIPIFLAGFILVLYLLGKFLAAGVGRLFWTQFERIINRLPFIRSIYSSVKQVTDFVFTERAVEFTRVVAVEYPRKGVWSLGFVTGESMADIRAAANEPVLSVLIPTSPMPATGYTITVRKSETVDLNITIDQAFQFCVSCGVVVPSHQQAGQIEQHVAEAIDQQESGGTPGPVIDADATPPTSAEESAPS